MKIGIVTQPLGANYGGILQNFALQETLREMGHEPITLRYNRRTWKWWVKNCLLVTLLKVTGNGGEYMPSPSTMRKQRAGLEGFINKHIATTNEFSQYTPSLTDGLDAIVVGSDQVWRPMYNKLCLPDVFLAFTKGKSLKRLSYAASFGTDQWEFTDAQARLCAEMLKDFDGVSVREASGIELCKKHLGYDNAVHVLDPTMMLTKKQYEKICCNATKFNGTYLCAYLLEMSDKKKRLVEETAKTHNLPVKWLSADGGVKPTDTIEAWLTAFRDAEYVVTDSFHGTAFSIIFQREFSTIGNKVRGNARMESLLGMFGLQERLIEQPSALPAIDWNNVNTHLDNKRKDSKNFLAHILK